MIEDMMETEAPELAVPYWLQPFEMKVQNLTRTFIDKVFAICDYYLLGKEKKHSRHIYDIYNQLPLASVDHSLPALTPEVRKARDAAAICPSAQDGVSISWLLQKIMDEHPPLNPVHLAPYKAHNTAPSLPPTHHGPRAR